MILDTPRLRLRRWQDSDRAAFAAMNADSEVMPDLGGPIGRAASDAKFDRYAAAQAEYGFSRWLIETRGGEFLGYSGVLPAHAGHPLGAHFEMGWRLVRTAWGFGFATEASGAALADAFSRVHLPEVLAYTAPDNARSQAVMAPLGLTRDTTRDFDLPYSTEGNVWRGLVWVARP